MAVFIPMSTPGHKAGDDYIRKTCAIICDVFSHSPVFRIGGDEFAVILQGRDHDRRDMLEKELSEDFDKNKIEGIRPCAFGLSEYNPQTDQRLQDVFERADKLMYENKKQCKQKLL